MESFAGNVRGQRGDRITGPVDQTLRYHSAVQPGLGRGFAAAASGVFLLAALSFVPLARFLHYARLGLSERGPSLLLVVPVVLAATLLHEAVVRGALYGAVGSRMAVGAAAPVVALLGAVLPAYLRLQLLPRGTAPLGVLAGHAFLVEAGLGLGLCLLALAAGSAVPGAIAYGLLWITRFGLAVTFVGSVVPMMELASAWATPLVLALVLARPLAPWREELLG